MSEEIEFDYDYEALQLLAKYGVKEVANGVLRVTPRHDYRPSVVHLGDCSVCGNLAGHWAHHQLNDGCHAAIKYLCEEWDFIVEGQP